MTNTTYFDLRVKQQDGYYPKVSLVADATLLNTRKVKSIDLEAVQRAIEQVLDGSAVEYASQNRAIAENH